MIIIQAKNLKNIIRRLLLTDRQLLSYLRSLLRHRGQRGWRVFLPEDLLRFGLRVRLRVLIPPFRSLRVRGRTSLSGRSIWSVENIWNSESLLQDLYGIEGGAVVPQWGGLFRLRLLGADPLERSAGHLRVDLGENVGHRGQNLCLPEAT